MIRSGQLKTTVHGRSPLIGRTAALGLAVLTLAGGLTTPHALAQDQGAHPQCSQAEIDALDTLLPRAFQAALALDLDESSRILEELNAAVGPQCQRAVAALFSSARPPGGGPMCSGGVCCDGSGCYP
jgi:hypothetical protein